MFGPELVNKKEPFISAVIVVYNDYRSLNLLIEPLCRQVDVIIIVDNSDAGYVAPESVSNNVNIIYHREKSNVGLAAGLNIGIRLAEKHQSNWILLLDQDSLVSENMIRIMMREYFRCPEMEKIGLICPDVFLLDKKTHQNPLRFGKFLSKKVLVTSDKVDFSITSGSMIKTSLFEVIGYMEEAFFIDYIDYDFCLRLRSENFKILFVQEAVLIHQLGERRVSNVGIKYTSHNPERVYFQTRNRLIEVRRYGTKFPAFAFMQISLFVLKFFKIIVIEDRKILRLQYYFSGFLDSFRKQYY